MERRLTAKSKKKDYKATGLSSMDRLPFIFGACHWGQLKLFYSELEFLTICAKTLNLDECTVVYVGAASGHHTVYLVKLFPKLKWILFDPREFFITESTNVSIFTKTDGFFRDETVQTVLDHPFVKNRKILYINDMRLGNDDAGGTRGTFEDSVTSEMLQQQRWGIAMNAEKMLLKCRFPYVDLTGVKDLSEHNYNLDHLQDRLHNYSPTPKLSKYEMQYLDGEIYFQLYAPTYSTETRLLVSKTKDNKYPMKIYNYKDYESQCYYYNFVTRKKQFRYKESGKLPHYVIGMTNIYENAAEYYIVEAFLERTAASGTAAGGTAASGTAPMKIIRTIYLIHYNLFQLTKRTLVSCDMATQLHDRIKTYKQFYDFIGFKTIDEIEVMIDNEYNRVVKMIDKQTEIFKTSAAESDAGSGIFPIDFFEKQLKMLDFEKNYIKKIYMQYKEYVDRARRK